MAEVDFTGQISSRNSTNSNKALKNTQSTGPTSSTASTQFIQCIGQTIWSLRCLCVCVSLCELIVCQTITSTILYRFSPNFACRSEMCSAWCLL